MGSRIRPIPWSGMNDPAAFSPWWIGSAPWQDEAHPTGAPPWAFVRDVDLATVPKDVQVEITAAAAYVLWINGTLVGSGPARSFPDRPQLDRHGVTALLHPGRNRLAVALVLGTGVIGYSVLSRPGLWIDARFGDQRIVSDASWRCRPMDWIGRHGLVASLPTPAQEHHRARHPDARWLTDGAVDGWESARLLGGAGTPPWRRMEARAVPLLAEAPDQPPLVWRGRSSPEAADPAANLARLFNQQPCTGAAVPPAQGAIDAEPGTVAVFDLGRTQTIRSGLRVEQAAPGCRLELFYDIGLGERPLASMGFGSRSEGFCDSFTPSGAGAWQGLAWRGCRFVAVRVVGGSCRFAIDLRRVSYPFPDDAAFACADPVLQRIWDLGAASLRSSMQDVPVDTCWREAQCWTLDACIQGKASYVTFGDPRPWRAALALAGQGIDADGLPRAVVPASDSFMILPDQALGWARGCGEYLDCTADRSLAAEVAPALRRLLARCAGDCTADGLYIPPDCCWHWVDWAPVERRAYALPVNAMLLLAAQTAVRLAAAIDDAPLAAVARGLVAGLTPALARFRDPAGGGLLAHLPGPAGVRSNGFGAGREMARHGIHGNALALAAGLDDPAVVAACRRFAGDADGLDGRFGIGWSDWVLQPLADRGHAAEAIAGLRRRCQPGLDAGLPTWGESWGTAVFNSAHGWGAAANSLLVGALCGLAPASPGWATVRFAPCPGMPDWTYRLRTPLGDLRAAMRGGVPELVLPAGCARA